LCLETVIFWGGVESPHISIQFIVDFRVHKITFNEDVCS